MRVSLSWVKRLLNVNELGISAEDLLARLSVRVAEFESDLEMAGPRLSGVVVGKVLTCIAHPNADKLRLTTVDVGRDQPLPIVCGAANVAVGLTVAVATVGTSLSMTVNGESKSITIKSAKLRGEPSEGMICAEDELGLGTSHAGVMALADHLKPGTALRDALNVGDTVMVIENHAITHRPDLWGQWGWAREIAAVLGLPPPAEPSIAWTDLGSEWSVDVRSAGCTAYCGAVVEGVTNTTSPEWMQRLLQSVGVRPLGLLIDITNFVMMELGEPMHAFDRRTIAGNRIIVRDALIDETLRTLDGKQHQLTAADILVADDRHGLALGGIMGGDTSMVTPDTQTIVLEAAIFRPDRIRRTRQRVGIATDSSARFEKNLYPELAPAAINRALALLSELCPGCRVSARFHAGTIATPEKTVSFAMESVARMTGVSVPRERQKELLTSLGFDSDATQVRIPWWRRKDVNAAPDVVEEIARLHGYELIQPETPRLPAAAPAENILRSSEHRTRRAMSALGWDEVATYAFTSEAWAQALGWNAGLVHLAHPLSSEQTVMRQSLLPSLAEAVGRNRKHRDRVAIYEIGRRYRDDRTQREDVVIAGMIAAADEQTPFYAARDAGIAVLKALGYDARFSVRVEAHAELAADRSGDIVIGKNKVGICGELPKALRSLADCPGRVGYFCIELESLVNSAGPAKPIRHIAPSRFPVVDRQFTWDSPEALAYGELETVMHQTAGELCVSVTLDSIYRGEPVAAGRKAVSMRIFLQAQDRTLDEKELQQLHTRIITSVEKRTPAKLRQ